MGNKKLLYWILAITLGIPTALYFLSLWIGYRVGEALIALLGLVPK